MSDKKVITFKDFLGWVDHPAGAIQASLGDVKGHYRLGDEPFVRTSAVVRIEYADTEGGRTPVEIETLNTIYRKEA